ncbi:MAG: F0F1 ATP synthase subunit delta [Anaerolineaceae bacterium]|jgi:F-type H+-transporting ATPase subunit b|nr:F0F1 ATP synthase subunit delta [Anaerolineaceae bacterium]
MLDISVPTIIWEILNFLALSIGLYFLLFRNVLKRVEERTKEKNRLLEEVKENRVEAEKMRADIETRLENLESETTAIVTKAQMQIDAEREDAIKKMQQEAERILNQALDEADQLKKETMSVFYQQAVETVLDVSGKVIHRTAPEELHAKLVAELFKQVWEMGKSGMQQVDILRQSLGDRDPIVSVETAFPLNPEQQRTLMNTFSALADRNVKVELTIRPELAAGMKIRIGDLIVDNTIAAQLAKLEEDVKQALQEKLANA